MFKGRLWLAAVLLTLVIIIILFAASRHGPVTNLASPPSPGESVLAALPADRCVTCHHRQTPTIVQQWAQSRHALNRTLCSDCHQVEQTYPGATEHYGTYITSVITPGICGKCHPAEVQQFARSRHSIPAWAAMVGYDRLTPHFQTLFNEITEIRKSPQGGEIPVGFVSSTRNALYDLEQELIVGRPIPHGEESVEGRKMMSLACEACHQIGRPNADGTAGNCNSCHLRHRFSLEQVRKPETCNRCHIGPDHPQWEIYQESAHGVLYATQGDRWNWNQVAGRLTVADFPAPTCQICHISGFGPQPTTHDVGDRLGWYLFADVSSRRPGWQDNSHRMQSICAQCHNANFIDSLYDRANVTTVGVNQAVAAAGKIVTSVVEDGLLTNKPFDHPIKFKAFDLWHYYGRTAKFGAWMQGADYTQWHGLYPMMNELSHIRAMVAELRSKNLSQPEVFPGVPSTQAAPPLSMGQ